MTPMLRASYDTAVKLFGEEFAEWISLTPQQRFEESMKLWDTYLALGGSLEPDADPQSPFFFREDWSPGTTDGRPSVRFIRRG